MINPRPLTAPYIPFGMLDNDIERITTRDWVDAFHVTKQVYTSDLRRAVNLGLLRKENGRGMGTRCSYVVPKGPYSNVRCLDLTRLQQEIFVLLLHIPV